MELIDGLLSRRSVRRFKSKSIPDDLIWKILKLANAAPSAGNLQSRDFIITRDEEIKQKLATAAHDQIFIHDAPVVIVVCGNQARSSSSYGNRGTDFYSIQDADAAVMHILLAALANDLGTCWVGAFDDDEVSAVLDLPELIRPIAIIPIGYPAQKPIKTSRVPIEKLVHYEKW